MRIGGIYSVKGGEEKMKMNYAAELQEIKDAIAAVDSIKHKNKVSKEKTMPGRILYKQLAVCRRETFSNKLN